MRYLESATADAAELVDHLSTIYEFADDGQPREQIERLLAELDDLGLIEASD